MKLRPLDQLSIRPEAGPLSQMLGAKGLVSTKALISFLTHLKYSRISDPENLKLILSEQRGTCSTKHAFFKAVAIEQDWDACSLILCLYKMNESNTPGVGSGLTDAGLAFIPEAHCYIKYADQRIDLTRPGAAIDKIQQDILLEVDIQPEQVGAWKKKFHQDYIRQWIDAESSDLTFDTLWSIREGCIASLAQ